MDKQKRTLRIGQGSSRGRTTVSGYVFKLARESAHQETANLNYWAGEIAQTQTNDDFMTHALRWETSGLRLFRHLLVRLTPGSHQVDLNIHTLWALLLARPALLNDRRDLRAALHDTLERISEDPSDRPCSPRTR